MTKNMIMLYMTEYPGKMHHRIYIYRIYKEYTDTKKEIKKEITLQKERGRES